MATIVRIEIINWEKYNPKRDQKTYTWLRLQNDIATDPELYELAPEQKWAWMCILAEASKKNSGIVDINLSWLSDQTKVSEEKILAALEILKQKPIIILHDRARPQTTARESITPPLTTPTNERTNERTNGTGTNERARARAAPPDLEAEEAKAWALHQDLAEYYRGQFEKRHKSPPFILPDDDLALTRLLELKGMTVPRLKKLINVYVYMDDPWFSKQGWNLRTLEKDIQKVATRGAA